MAAFLPDVPPTDSHPPSPNPLFPGPGSYSVLCFHRAHHHWIPERDSFATSHVCKRLSLAFTQGGLGSTVRTVTSGDSCASQATLVRAWDLSPLPSRLPLSPPEVPQLLFVLRAALIHPRMCPAWGHLVLFPSKTTRPCV